MEFPLLEFLLYHIFWDQLHHKVINLVSLLALQVLFGECHIAPIQWTRATDPRQYWYYK